MIAYVISFFQGSFGKAVYGELSIVVVMYSCQNLKVSKVVTNPVYS